MIKIEVRLFATFREGREKKYFLEFPNSITILKVIEMLKIDEKEGVILAIDNISLLVKFEDTKVVYPIKYIANSRIEIVD